MPAELKLISTWIFAFSIVLSVLVYVGKVNVYQVYFNWDLVLTKKQFWRIFTSLLYFGPLGLNVVLGLFGFRFLMSCEKNFFETRPLDFLLFIAFAMAAVLFYAYETLVLLPGGMFTTFFMFYWAKRSPEVNFFFFNIRVRASYFIYLISFKEIAQGSFDSLYVLLASHIYFLLHDVINLKYDTNLLKFPDEANKFVRNLLRN